MSIAPPPPETLDQRKARQYGALHTIGDLALDLAQDAHTQAKRQLAAPPAKEERDCAATFASMSRAVRQAIAIEIRLDTAPTRLRPTFRAATPAPDPRRILLRDAFHKAVEAARRPEIDAAIDEILAADPDQQVPMDNILDNLCQSLGIALDVRRMPNALLFYGLPHPVGPPPFDGPPCNDSPAPFAYADLLKRHDPNRS